MVELLAEVRSEDMVEDLPEYPVTILHRVYGVCVTISFHSTLFDIIQVRVTKYTKLHLYVHGFGGYYIEVETLWGVLTYSSLQFIFQNVMNTNSQRFCILNDGFMWVIIEMPW